MFFRIMEKEIRKEFITERTSWIVQNGQLILFDDFENANEDELLYLIPKAANYILENDVKDILRLTNVRNCSSSTKVVDISKVNTLKIKEHSKKSAVYGATTLQRVLVMFVSNFVRLEIKMFATKQEAINYLLAKD